MDILLFAGVAFLLFQAIRVPPAGRIGTESRYGAREARINEPAYQRNVDESAT